MDNQDFDITEPGQLSLEELFGDEFAEELDFLKEKCPDREPASGQKEDRKPDRKPVRRPASRIKKKEDDMPWPRAVLMYLHDLAFLLTAVILLFLLCFRVVVVSGTSMNNTLLDGDYLLLLGDVFYRNPQPGDVVVASKESFDHGTPIVKRVIATEGQTVDIDFEEGVVYVDGVALEEPYTRTPTNVEEGMEFPLTVDAGCIFVMGDNRNGSKDSRNPEIGLVDRREVLGKVVFLFLPGTNGTDIYGRPNESRDFGRIGVVS